MCNGTWDLYQLMPGRNKNPSMCFYMRVVVWRRGAKSDVIVCRGDMVQTWHRHRHLGKEKPASNASWQ